jgi:hypothetical protein
MTKQIMYKEVIEIDRKQYTISNCDYSESIQELIKDNIIENDNQEIINHIVDDIANLDYH